MEDVAHSSNDLELDVSIAKEDTFALSDHQGPSTSQNFQKISSFYSSTPKALTLFNKNNNTLLTRSSQEAREGNLVEVAETGRIQEECRNSTLENDHYGPLSPAPPNSSPEPASCEERLAKLQERIDQLHILQETFFPSKSNCQEREMRSRSWDDSSRNGLHYGWLALDLQSP